MTLASRLSTLRYLNRIARSKQEYRLTFFDANIAKPSFTKKCPHLIDERIGRWMRDEGHAPWPNRKPPTFAVEPGDRRFRVVHRL